MMELIWVLMVALIATVLASECDQGINLRGAAAPGVDGCYVLNGSYNNGPRYTQEPTLFQAAKSLPENEIFIFDGVWRIGTPDVVAKYSARCPTGAPPSGNSFTIPGKGVSLPGPVLSSTSIALAEECQQTLVKNCTCPSCTAIWGPQGCPDLYSVRADLTRPPMINGTAGAGQRIRETEPSYVGTKAYHALYLPTDWNQSAVANGRRYPVIVEFMGNGPWTDGEDISTGRPEDQNLGYGISGGQRYIWISMPFLTSDLGPNTEISTFWWGCPEVEAKESCGNEYNITPTVDYTQKTVAMILSKYGGDPDNIILTGWSRGAIACGAIGLHNDEIAKLWKAFIPYSHLDGDCGWVDQFSKQDLLARYQRLNGRPYLSIAECNVATQIGKSFLDALGVSGNITFATTSFHNHNDAWVLRPSKGRDLLRSWLNGIVDTK